MVSEVLIVHKEHIQSIKDSAAIKHIFILKTNADENRVFGV